MINHMFAVLLAMVVIGALFLGFEPDVDTVIPEQEISVYKTSSTYKALVGQRIYLNTARQESCVFGGVVDSKIVLSYDSFPAYYPLGSKYVFCSGVLVKVVTVDSRHIELKPAKQMIEDVVKKKGSVTCNEAVYGND